MRIRFETLTKEYDGKKVLDIASGGVKGGSRTAVIGSNGAGKSTLINIIAGLSRPTTGTIYYGEGEKETAKIPSKEITLVFQSPYLITATVEKNIAYPLKLRGWDKDEIDERVGELAGELGLSDFLKRRSFKLSGGEVQKVALARALSFRPKLLLLDEPTANIDPATTAEIERMLFQINEKEGTTIIIITHNLVQAKRTCDQLLFLDKGQLVEWGDCGRILTEPRDERSRKFIAGELLI